MTDLKPCPFCGGMAYTATWYKGWFCGAWHEDDCILNHSVLPDYETQEEAIQTWNRRMNDEIT